MTTDQRLDRIEHLTAGIAEERNKDREEYKALWRDTQAQLNALATDTRLRFEQVANRFDQVANRFDQIAERLDKIAADAREADAKLSGRIESMVSAIAKSIAKE